LQISIPIVSSRIAAALGLKMKDTEFVTEQVAMAALRNRPSSFILADWEIIWKRGSLKPQLWLLTIPQVTLGVATIEQQLQTSMQVN
jgi:hypothetical protein